MGFTKYNYAFVDHMDTLAVDWEMFLFLLGF